MSSETRLQRPADFALEFARALARRDYPGAYGMTAQDFRSDMSCGEMTEEFEAIVPQDWGAVDPIELGSTMAEWPGKEPNDLEWVYVTLGGDIYSEAVTAIVSDEDGQFRIRDVEWGRP